MPGILHSLLGQMTTAWEIWEQLGQRVPDWFVAPTGHGGSLLGTWRGFQHLQSSGVTDKLPRLVAVQAEPYTPLYDAFCANLDRVVESPRMGHISADGIAISSPVRSNALLAALRRSHGTVFSVTEEEVVEYHKKLAQRGLFVEPTSATVAVALDKMRDMIVDGDIVVAVLTGHGLKNPPIID